MLRWSVLFLNRMLPLFRINFACLGLYNKLTLSRIEKALRLLFTIFADISTFPFKNSISLRVFAVLGGRIYCRALSLIRFKSSDLILQLPFTSLFFSNILLMFKEIKYGLFLKVPCNLCNLKLEFLSSKELLSLMIIALLAPLLE